MLWEASHLYITWWSTRLFSALLRVIFLVCLQCVSCPWAERSRSFASRFLVLYSLNFPPSSFCILRFYIRLPGRLLAAPLSSPVRGFSGVLGTFSGPLLAPASFFQGRVVSVATLRSHNFFKNQRHHFIGRQDAPHRRDVTSIGRQDAPHRRDVVRNDSRC